jgi:antitoxin MazE
MKARLVRVGNSRGIRLPKPFIEEAGLGDDVDIRVKNGAVVIRPAARCRSGWAEAALRARGRGESGLLDEPTSSRFDDEEWKWE